jgi:hypothetical protein
MRLCEVVRPFLKIVLGYIVQLKPNGFFVLIADKSEDAPFTTSEEFPAIVAGTVYIYIRTVSS